MPHTRLEYEKEISQIDKQIAQLESHRDELAKSRTQLDVGQLVEAKRIRKELDEVEGSLSDLNLLKQAAKEQLAKWKKNAARAAPLVEDGGAAHERGRDIFVKLAEHQAEVRDLVKELDQEVNVTMSTKAKEFGDLTGESMGLTLSMVCYPAMAFAAAETIKPYDSWTYHSETELKEAHKAELDKKLEQHEVRVKVAEEHAPPCPICGTKMVVDKRSGHLDTPGQAGSGHTAHQWYLVCRKCGATQTVSIPETRHRDQVVSIASGSVKPRNYVRHPDF